MTAPQRRGPYRIALKIYVVTVAAVLASAAALFLVLRLAREERPPHDPFLDVARYATSRIAARWGSAEAVKEELDALAREARFGAAAYRWDGEIVASASASPEPPLSAEERDTLARTGAAERRGDCFRGRCAVAFPVTRGSASEGYVLVAAPRPPGPRPPPPELFPLALVLVGLGIAAALLGSSIARPLDRLARTARALGSGDLAARTGLARRDELGAVARAFDDMADRLLALVRAQTELVANVAHELRTPLARIHVALDLAAEGDAAVAREALAEIGEDLAELERLVEDVLASARMDLAANTASGGAPTLRRVALDVATIATDAAARLRARHPERRVVLELEPELPSVEGDPVLLRRALDNLLDNARKYSPPDREIRLSAARRGERVSIEVVDRGEGIAPDDLERLFTPFFRADRSRARATGGIGLGLALSRRIVEAHGGTIAARSVLGAGTTMTVDLPARPAPAP